jgi:hypothetical protein
MLIETRILGRKAGPLDGWSVPLPPPADDGDEGMTLRRLISRIVRTEVESFGRRELARRFVRVLSEAEIADGATRGKVDSGGRAPTGPVNPEHAIGAALQGFEDGLYLVILDGVEQRQLDAQIFPKPDSRLVFLRLTFLAGA